MKRNVLGFLAIFVSGLALALGCGSGEGGGDRGGPTGGTTTEDTGYSRY